MKVWPIITLVGLIWGSTLADPKGVGREGKPHPRHHLSEFDPDDFVAPNMPHRPVTMTFREVFAKLLNEETDWSAPDGKAAQAEADADDGQDPGKKLFWSTNHPDIPGVPFTGWGDPNAEPDHPLVSPPACSTCRPELFFTIIVDDPVPPKEDENFAAEAQAHAVFGNLLFGALKALDNMIVAPAVGGGLVVTIAPCETIMVNGVCPMPCKGDDDPLCRDASEIPPILTEPGGPIVVDRTPPSFIGGGSGVVVGQAGSVPEASTWLMGLIGFGFLSLFRRSVRSTASGLIPRPTKA